MKLVKCEDGAYCNVLLAHGFYVYKNDDKYSVGAQFSVTKNYFFAKFTNHLYELKSFEYKYEAQEWLDNFIRDLDEYTYPKKSQ